MNKPAQITGELFAPKGKELRQRAIKEALTEFVTQTLTESQCRARLADNKCDEAQIDALISSAPKTILPRKKKRFKNEELPLIGGSGTRT